MSAATDTSVNIANKAYATIIVLTCIDSNGDCSTGISGVISGDIKLRWLTSRAKALIIMANAVSRLMREMRPTTNDAANSCATRAIKSIVS